MNGQDGDGERVGGRKVLGIDGVDIGVGDNGGESVNAGHLGQGRRPGDNAAGVDAGAGRGGQLITERIDGDVRVRSGVGDGEALSGDEGAIGLNGQHRGDIDLVDSDNKGVGGAERAVGDDGGKAVGARALDFGGSPGNDAVG